MSWQEELRKLDDELATGRISADEYRVRRDKVLASAVSSPQAAPAGQTGHPEATQTIQPVQPPAEGGTPDRTPVVPGAQSPAGQPPTGPDRTQVVQGWQTARPNTGGDPDRTQVVPGQSGGFAPPPGGYPQHQAPPPWSTQQDANDAPPWAGSEFPPLNAAQNYDWLRQGPEVFDEKPKGKRGLVIGIVVAVVVLALAGGAVWWFTASPDDETPPVGQTTTAPPTTTTPAGPPRPLEGVDGQVDDANSGDITVADAGKKSQFSPDEVKIFGECEAEEGQTEVLYQSTWYTLVHVFTCGDPGKADATATKLLNQQKEYGFKAYDAPESLDGMIIENATDVPDAPVDARVFYVSDDKIVRVEVRGRNKTTVGDGLAEVLGAVTTNFPKK